MNKKNDAAQFLRGIFASPFRPAWWLRNAHAQTLFSNFCRAPVQLVRVRESIAFNDGDFVDIDWSRPPQWQPHQPVVLVVHGLSGSSESHYVLGVQAELQARGWASAALNCRGASGRQNNLPRSYHAGASDDVLRVLDFLRAHYPQAPLAVVGYSLGGNMTLKMLGESAENNRVFAGVAVSVPLLLPLCSDQMDKGFSRVYRHHFMTTLTAHWEDKARHFEQAGNAAAAQRVREKLKHGPFRSFWHYDNAVMAPLHGFNDVHDYYQQSSSRQFLKKITAPTLVIHAHDDPFMTPKIIPYAEELSGSVCFELCAKGGHVGFIEGGSPRRPKYYLERRIPDFLQAVLAGGV